MRKILFFLLVSLWATTIYAQLGDEAYSFLRIPSSTRVSALGGDNISVVECDPSLGFHNPALLGKEMDNMLNLNYMNYISDVNIGSAIYTKAFKEKGAWGVGASVFSYGKIPGYTEENQQTGDLSAKDINIQGFFSYDLSEKWRGGLSLKFLYSSMAEYNSFGMGVDAGLSYYDSEKNFSFGFVLKNIGAQFKSYYDERQKMPWDIHISLTAVHLNRWKFDYVDDSDKEYDGDSFAQALLKHFVVGVDWLPSDNFWVGVGYNPKRAMDMKLSGGNALSGFSAGAGIHVKMFDVSASLAKYHPSALSMMITVTTYISDFKL